MTRLRWMFMFALLGACLGPKGEQAPTMVQASAPDARVAEAPRPAEAERAPAGVKDGQEPPISEHSGHIPASLPSESGPEPVREDDIDSTASAANSEAADADGAAEQTGAAAPEHVQEKRPQPQTNPALVRQGRQVFSNVCMLCHDMGPRIAGLGWTPQRMERKIRHGGTRMSAISTDKLPDPKLQALMTYLRTIGAVRGDET